MAQTYDIAVVGAGVFGAWIAYHLQRSGRKVVLIDAYGAANSRASSGGESRIIRMGYGADEVYTRWAVRSLALWQEFFRQTGQPLFHRTGMLWMAREEDPYTLLTLATLEAVGVPFERLSRAELERRYPQFSFGLVTWAVFEPGSGVLMARRAVQAVVGEVVRLGAVYMPEAVVPPAGRGRLDALVTLSGTSLSAESYVFACGPWLPKLFPDLLRDRIHATRQEVFFVGTPAGDARFAPPPMPAWIDFGEEVYGLPDLEHRGFKIALDRHGPDFDPDTGGRIPSEAILSEVRQYLARRFPALKEAPVLEARVCQYENTSNGDFLIDHHPELENVWMVGGGSGHGFKHGPAVGEYATARIHDHHPVEARFALATKGTARKRSVF